MRLFFFIAAMVSVGCGSQADLPEIPTPDLSDAYPEVKEFIAGKRDAVEGNRRSGSAWGAYAMALDAHEYDNTAEKCYEVAVSLEPEVARWKYLLARRLEVQHPERAVELLRSVPAQGEAKTVICLKLADLLEQLGDVESLDAVLHQLRQQPSDCQAVSHRLAISAFAKGDVDLADKLIRSIRGEFHECVRLRVKIDTRNGQLRKVFASEELPSVMITVTDPFSAEVDRFRRDPLWLGKKASDEALTGSRIALMHLELLVRKHPELADNRVQLALNFSQRNGNDRAEQLLLEGLEPAPRNVKLLVALATIRTLQSKWQAAEETLRQILELNANHAAAWADLGFSLEQQARQTDAIGAYRTAIRLNPRDDELATRLQSLLESRE